MQVSYNHEETVRNKPGQLRTHVITTHIIRAHLKISPSLSHFTDTIKTRKMQKIEGDVYLLLAKLSKLLRFQGFAASFYCACIYCDT